VHRSLSEFSNRHFAGQLFFFFLHPSSIHPSLFPREPFFSFRIFSRKPKKPSKKNTKNYLQKIPFYLISNPLHCALCGIFSFNRLISTFQVGRVLDFPSLCLRFSSLRIGLGHRRFAISYKALRFSSARSWIHYFPLCRPSLALIRCSHLSLYSKRQHALQCSPF